MATNWVGGREKAIANGLWLVVDRGYTPVEAVAASMVRIYYRGRCPERVVSAFERDLTRLVTEARAQAQAARYDELKAMENALIAEGWRYLSSVDRPGGFWWHDQHGSVNNMGGGFLTFDEATRRAFQSELRAMVNQ